MKYYIQITETLSRTIAIEAPTSQDALSEVEGRYDDEEIVLSADDFVGREIIENPR